MHKLSVWILSLVLIFTLAAAGAPARAAGVTPARFLPGDDAPAPAANTQNTPAIANGGGVTLISWSDSRGIISAGTDTETGRDIYAMRVDAAGNLLDPVAFPITTGPASQVNPKIAWNGTNFLVVYESNALSGTGYYQASLEAVRVSPAGTVLDPRPIQLIGLTPSGSAWSVASDGANWVIAHQGTSTSIDIVGMRISPDGVVLDPPNRRLVEGTYYMRFYIRLAYAGGVFLLTYNDAYLNGTYDTKAVRFDANLNLLDSAPFQLLTVPAGSLTATGSTFYLAWLQQQPDGSTAIYGSRLDTAGQKLDGSGDNLSNNQFTGLSGAVAAVWDGVNWRVIWIFNFAVRTARVSTAGQVLDPGGVAVAGPQVELAAGVGNGSVQTVWSPYVNADQGVLTANISAGNTAGPNNDVSLGAPQQLGADAATNGSGYMLVYRSSTGSGSRILAQPLDAAANPTTAGPVQLDSGDVLNGPSSPAIGWNGSVYLAIWANASGIVAQRLNPDGSLVDAAPFVVITSAFGSTDVEALGDTFLVVGRKCGYTCQSIGTVAARVSGVGVVLDSSPIQLGFTYASSPRVVTLGGRWLVAYQNNATHDDSIASTLGAFVDSAGVASAVFTIHSTFSTAGGNGIFSLGLASNGTVAILVQSQELSSGVENDLLARLILPDGTVQPYLNLTPWRGNQYRPRAAWDGTNFVVVYQEQKNRFADLDMLDATSDLFGMRISPAGTVIDPLGFVFSTDPAGVGYPNLVALNGLTLIAGSILRPEAPYANYRIGYTQIDSRTNQFPVAVAVATPAGGDIPLAVSFSSAGSTDPDGSLASFTWDFGDNITSSEANPSHTYTTAGPFIAHLTVTDNGGASNIQAILVQATAPNQLPVAVAAATPISGPAPLDVVFNAAGSYDPDGFIGNIQWTFHDGSTYWGSPAYYTYNTNGTFVATLTVFDSRGATGSTTITITVGQSNQAPVAVASGNPTSGNAPLTVAFSSAGSYDSDGTIASYSWTFGDGGTSTEANPSHTYTSSGSYTARLTVTDNQGATGTASVSITATGGCTIRCLRSSAITLTSRGTTTITVTGKVTVRDQANRTVSNAFVYITWTRPDGTKLTQSAYTNSRGLAQFSVTGGRGTFNLTVTDITKINNTFDPANSILTKSLTV